MTAVPARQVAHLPAPRRLTASVAVVQRRLDELEAEAARGGLLMEQIASEQLSGGRVRVDVHFVLPPAVPIVRWWQGRSWKFWTPVAAGGVLAFGGCLVAAVIVLMALIGAVKAIATMALGALVLVGFFALVGSVKGGGGTWTGSGTWR